MLKKQILIMVLLVVVFTFSGCNIFSPTLTPSSYISVSVFALNGGTVSGTGNYEINTNVTVTAIPNLGYSFSNWTKNGAIVSEDATYTFAVTQNIVLYANFIYIGNEELEVVSGTFYRVEQDSETNFITQIEILNFLSAEELNFKTYSYNTNTQNYDYSEKTNSYVVNTDTSTLSIYDYEISETIPTNEFTYILEQNTSLQLVNQDETYLFYIYEEQSLTGLFENSDSSLYYEFKSNNNFTIYYESVYDYEEGTYLLFNDYCIITLNNSQNTILVYDYVYTNNILTLGQNTSSETLSFTNSQKVKVNCVNVEDLDYIVGLGFYNINDTVNLEVLSKRDYVLTGIKVGRFVIYEDTSHSFTVTENTNITLYWAIDDGEFIPMPN